MFETVESMISQQAIAKRIGELGSQIQKDYQDKEEPLLIGTLKGSFVFIADLARAIDLPLHVDFISAASYGEATVGGDVRILKDTDMPIEGRHVIVVEDIVDTGNTLCKIIGLLQARQPASLEICAFLDKPSRRKVPVDVKYIGFQVEDVFVVGYGLDYAQKYRNLPFVGVLGHG